MRDKTAAHTEHQLIKLPANKFTVREREMLTGTVGVPNEFFSGGSPVSKVLLAGAVCTAPAQIIVRIAKYCSCQAAPALDSCKLVCYGDPATLYDKGGLCAAVLLGAAFSFWMFRQNQRNDDDELPSTTP